MKHLILHVLTMLFFLPGIASNEIPITRIWLTHSTNDPSAIVVNWHSKYPGNSEVYFRIDEGQEFRITNIGKFILHHVQIPLAEKDVMYSYRVKTGNEASLIYRFKGYPSDKNEMRIALVGNWGFSNNPDLSHLIENDPHLLITLGDNIPDLNQLCGEGVKDCIEPFLRLIDSQPQLFQTTPFMPILGNHDKQIRPRGEKYPPKAVYDTTALAYRKFFELPDEEWKWIFNIPNFDVTFIALDLNHITDYGTTWQTCHSFFRNSEQFNWYSKSMENSKKGYIITLNNEQNQMMRKQAQGEWQKLFQKGSMVITGFGYFFERAEVDGFPYFNTSLQAGDQFPDQFSKIIKPIGGYILLTFNKNQKLEIKAITLEGSIMDSFHINPSK